MKPYWYSAAAFLLLVLSGQAWPVEKQCDFCHSSHGGAMTLLDKDINALCSGCHAERLKGGEHKVGMSPSMTVRDLPLQSGKVTCITCHDPHGKGSSMLRIPADKICISCHVK